MHAWRLEGVRLARHRFYVPPSAIRGPVAVVEGEAVHHITRVLRLQRHDSITLFDGSGREYLGRIVAVDRRAVTVTIERVEEAVAPSRPAVTLVQAIPRHGKMETIIERATELGVDRVVPMQTARTVPLLREHADRIATRWQRWSRVAIEAAQQSGRQTVPALDAVQPFTEALAIGRQSALALLAAVAEVAVPLPSVLSAATHIPSVSIFIGPEGDFAPEEVAAAQAAGCRLVSLGSTVLRCETAAIAALAMINYAFHR